MARDRKRIKSTTQEQTLKLLPYYVRRGAQLLVTNTPWMIHYYAFLQTTNLEQIPTHSNIKKNRIYSCIQHVPRVKR